MRPSSSIRYQVATVRSVQRRTMVLDDHMAERLVSRLRDGAGSAVAGETAPVPQGPPGSPPLTDREREVARWVAAEASNREIARNLHLGEGTIKNHVSAILRKLGLRDRTQLAIAMKKP